MRNRVKREQKRLRNPLTPHITREVLPPSLSSGVFYPLHCWVWITRRHAGYGSPVDMLGMVHLSHRAGYGTPVTPCWVWITRGRHAGYGSPVGGMLGIYTTLPCWVYTTLPTHHGIYPWVHPAPPTSVRATRRAPGPSSVCRRRALGSVWEESHG